MRFLLAVFCVSTFIGCVSNKKLTYLQESERGFSYELNFSNYKVQPNDILSISIRSIDLRSAAAFNNLNLEANNVFGGGDIYFYLNGYSVNDSGYINVPVVGEIYVKDSNIDEIEKLMRLELAYYFKDVFVNVQLSGIRFSVIGDVTRPGKFTIYQDRATIFEALAMSGDINITGDRKNVQVIRQKGNENVISYIDLTDSEIQSSEYFFIQPNDIINVRPLKVKSFGIGTTGFQTFALSLSALANVLLIITTLNSL